MSFMDGKPYEIIRNHTPSTKDQLNYLAERIKPKNIAYNVKPKNMKENIKSDIKELKSSFKQMGYAAKAATMKDSPKRDSILAKLNSVAAAQAEAHQKTMERTTMPTRNAKQQGPSL